MPADCACDLAQRQQRGLTSRFATCSSRRLRKRVNLALEAYEERQSSLKSLETEIKSEMANPSAGILMYRRSGEEILVLLVHPGGPFWKKKDLGAWSIPKGEHGPDEDAETAARREFFEELGEAPSGALRPLGRVRQRGGKWVEAFALEGDFDVENVKSDSFALEWPPKSGNIQHFPEIDRAEWFSLPSARVKILASQLPFLDRLEEFLSKASARPGEKD
jgi:predicted NUDIX family NTP pyrophosphohydrolase